MSTGQPSGSDTLILRWEARVIEMESEARRERKSLDLVKARVPAVRAPDVLTTLTTADIVLVLGEDIMGDPADVGLLGQVMGVRVVGAANNKVTLTVLTSNNRRQARDYWRGDIDGPLNR
jgi:hypothetical protein